MLLCIKKNLENLDETGDFKSEIESAFLTWITWCGTLLKLGNDRKNKEHDLKFVPLEIKDDVSKENSV